MDNTAQTQNLPKARSDDPMPPQFAALSRVEEVMDSKNPLALLITALLTLLKEIFTPEKDDTAQTQDFRGTDAERRTAIERDATEQKKAEAEHRTVRDSARTLELIPVPHRLMKMREEAERANGGKHVEAIMPVASDGRITEGKGQREKPREDASSDHKGLDIASATPGGKPDIISAMPGVVVAAGRAKGYGNVVYVEDIYGSVHRYGHLDSIAVKEGEAVQQGQKLGVMGMTGVATGVHLHYEQRTAKGEVMYPELMGRYWHKGDPFTLKQNMQFAVAQKQGGTVLAEASPAKPKAGGFDLAGIDLGAVSANEGAYVPPAAKKPVSPLRG